MVRALAELVNYLSLQLIGNAYGREKKLSHTRLITAMHESGHAVINSVILPSPAVRSISVTGDAEGFTESDPRFPFVLRDVPVDGRIRELWVQNAYQDVLGFLAGPIAELRWKRTGHWNALFSMKLNREWCLHSPDLEQGEDWWQVRWRLQWAYPNDQEAVFERAWYDTCDLVAAHWVPIQRLGRELHRLGRIDGDALSELLPKPLSPGE